MTIVTEFCCTLWLQSISVTDSQTDGWTSCS